MKSSTQIQPALVLPLVLLLAISGFSQPAGMYKDLPVGKYRIGFQIISITDSSRFSKTEEDYSGDKTEGSRYRSFTVHLWYPAAVEGSKKGLQLADYTYNHFLSTAAGSLSESQKSARLQTIRASIERWFGRPDDAAWNQFLQTPMLATADAKPLAQKFPLLIGMLRPFSTTLTNEVLASNGYVVAMVSAPDFSSFANAALYQVPDMQLAVHQLRHRFDESRIGVYGFSGAGFIPVLFGMFDPRVKALADLESGIYMKDLHQALSSSNYYQPTRLRIPFLHIFSADLSRQEAHLDELEKKTKFSTRYRLLMNQPALHHWDFATEGYGAATALNLRGEAAGNVKRSFEISTLYLLHFFNAILKDAGESRLFLSAKPRLPGTADSLWTVATLTAMKPAPTTDEFETIIRKKGIEHALTVVKATLPGDSSTDVLQGFRLNRLGYALLVEKKYKEAIGVFELNTELHPDDANFFDSLSEAYEAAGDKSATSRAAQQVIQLLDKKSTLTDADKALKASALKRQNNQ